MISFYSTNLVDQATVTASSENQLFPVENIQDYRRTKVFRSQANSVNIDFDLGETSEIDSIILVDDPRSEFGLSTVTLQLNGSTDFSSPAFSQALTLNEYFGVGYAEFDLQEYRYARLVVTSTLGYCEISNLFIGKKIAFENNMVIDFGWSYQNDEIHTTKKNRYGQRFIDAVTRQSKINFSIKSMNPDELDQILEIYDTKGETKPFFMRLGCDDMINDKDRFAGMYFLANVPSITNKSFALYDMSFQLEEAM
jgi:hypothetical protein